MSQKWVTDWQKFRRQNLREDIALFGALRLQAQADLYPMTWKLAFKILSLFLSASGIAYLAFHYLHLKVLFQYFGQSGGIFLRGFAFETINMWVTGLFLTPEQMTAVSSRRITILLSFIVISFICYGVVTLRPWDWMSWLWLLGAIVAAMAQANTLFPISEQ